jgi:hypothetical protein
MSLRKRQAINSDGGNYRNYSKTGILWSTIDKNRHTIDKNSVLAGTTPKATGQVTGLSFHTHSADGSAYSTGEGEKGTVWVSDPSDAAIALDVNPVSDDVRNLTDGTFSTTDTTTDVSTGARGLVFTTRCKRGLTGTKAKGTKMDFQYIIEKRGSGYKVGDYIVVKETALGPVGGSDFLVKVMVTSVNNQRS